ncbi:unnamed protein product [Clonostachys chloroleuca]|uniref:Uncharacterized protein n=1 Tax=Clonostachys chloroleuca TaxID=1926264 RepID=A0AA35MFK7_9HYPO|nr:unnamed protein product [Clonostachys chloroleuca]
MSRFQFMLRSSYSFVEAGGASPGLFSNILVNQSVVSIENAISTKQILGEIMGMAMFLETMMGSSTSLVPLVQFQ